MSVGAPTVLEELCKRTQHCFATLRRSRNKRMLGVVGWKVWPVSNFAQQHATTCNRVCNRTQHVTSNNVGSCWSTMLRPFARSLILSWNECRQTWLKWHMTMTYQVLKQLGDSIEDTSQIASPTPLFITTLFLSATKHSGLRTNSHSFSCYFK